MKSFSLMLLAALVSTTSFGYTLEVGVSRQTFTGQVYVDDATLAAAMLSEGTRMAIEAGVPAESAAAVAAASIPGTDTIPVENRLVNYNLRSQDIKRLAVTNSRTDAASVIYRLGFYRGAEVYGSQLMIGYKSRQISGFDFFSSLSAESGGAYGLKTGYVPASVGTGFNFWTARLSASAGYNTTAKLKEKESDYKFEVNPWSYNARLDAKINENSGVWGAYEDINTLGENQTSTRKSLNLGLDYGF